MTERIEPVEKRECAMPTNVDRFIFDLERLCRKHRCIILYGPEGNGVMVLSMERQQVGDRVLIEGDSLGHTFPDRDNWAADEMRRAMIQRAGEAAACECTPPPGWDDTQGSDPRVRRDG